MGQLDEKIVVITGGPHVSAYYERLIADLDPEAERILLAHGTEAPFCGGLLDEKRAGVFCW